MDLDCRECGACCISSYDQGYYVELSDKDYDRLPPHYQRRHTTQYGNWWEDFFALMTKWRSVHAGPIKSSRICACVALRGSPMQQVSCAIYEQRPEPCRAFKPGSKMCLEVRRELLEKTES